MKPFLLPSHAAANGPSCLALTAGEQQQVADWIDDAIAILQRRASSGSAAETMIRFGFATIARNIDSPGVRGFSGAAAPTDALLTSTEDLRQIITVLDACLGIFQRHDSVLNTAQRRIQILVRATRRHVDAELHARMVPVRTVRSRAPFAGP